MYLIVGVGFFLFVFSDLDLPKPGHYVSRFDGLPPGIGVSVPGEPNMKKLQFLVYGDSLCCRGSLAIPARTCIGKFFQSGIGSPEYGHLDCSHFLEDEPAEVRTR